MENGIRLTALGRKNWLHLGSEAAGQRVAAVASVVENWKCSGIGVKEYLESVLPGLKTALAREVGALTPHAWKQHHAPAR